MCALCDRRHWSLRRCVKRVLTAACVLFPNISQSTLNLIVIICPPSPSTNTQPSCNSQCLSVTHWLDYQMKLSVRWRRQKSTREECGRNWNERAGVACHLDRSRQTCRSAQSETNEIYFGSWLVVFDIHNLHTTCGIVCNNKLTTKTAAKFKLLLLNDTQSAKNVIAKWITKKIVFDSQFVVFAKTLEIN